MLGVWYGGGDDSVGVVTGGGVSDDFPTSSSSSEVGGNDWKLASALSLVALDADRSAIATTVDTSSVVRRAIVWPLNSLAMISFSPDFLSKTCSSAFVTSCASCMDMERGASIADADFARLNTGYTGFMGVSSKSVFKLHMDLTLRQVEGCWLKPMIRL